MVINLYTITKKRNSTAQPSGSGTDVTANWNDGVSSILAPSLRVYLPSDTYLAYNYCKIASLGRYYYIQDWKYNGDGTWTALLECDVLASWKASIQSSYGYVDRADNVTFTSNDILDTFYPATMEQYKVKSAISTTFTSIPSGGTFVICVLGNSNPVLGPVTPFVVSSYQMGILMSSMMTRSTQWSDIDALSEDVLKSFINPMQYITRVMWLPFTTSFLEDTTISLGGWSTGATGHRLTTNMMQFHNTISVPQGTGYKKYPPYATYTLIAPAFGTFQLDGTILAKTPTIQYAVNIDMVNGSATLIVATKTLETYNLDAEYELLRASTQFGIEIPMAQISTNYAGMAKGALSVAGSAAAGAAGSVGVVSGIASAVEAAIAPVVQSTGSLSGGFNLDINMIYIEAIFYKTVDESPEDFGYPIKKRMQLTSFTGYVKMAHSEFDAACTSTEKDQIISLLEGGIYIE